MYQFQNNKTNLIVHDDDDDNDAMSEVSMALIKQKPYPEAMEINEKSAEEERLVNYLYMLCL